MSIQPTAPLYCVCGPVRERCFSSADGALPPSYLSGPGQTPREYIERYRNMYPVAGVGYTGTLLAAQVAPVSAQGALVPTPTQGPLTLVGHVYSPYLLMIPPRV